MRRDIVAVVAALIAAALSLASVAHADRVIAGGEPFDCPTSIVETDDELLAPLLPALESLGCRVAARASRLSVVGPRGQTIVITEGESKARTGKVTSDLQAAPRREKDTWLLPTRSLAALLGWTVRWDAAKRQLELLVRVRSVTVSDKGEGGLRVSISATGSLKSRNRVGWLENPDRLYLDISGADLVVPEDKRVQKVAGHAVSEICVAQTSSDPPVVRVALRVAESIRYYLGSADNGCTLNVKLTAGGVELRGIEVHARSPNFAQVTLKMSGPAKTRVLPLSPGDGYGHRLLVFIENGKAAIAQPRSVAKDSPIVGIRFTEETEEHPFGVVLDLKAKTGHAVTRHRDHVIIYVGTPKLEDLCVVIDPGHGGIFPGAVYGGMCEKDLNLDISQRLAKVLREAGAEVHLTRERDQETIPGCGRGDLRKELAERTALADKTCADLFISVHCNACAKPNTRRGSEVYYHFARPQERGLAEALAAALRGLGIGGLGVRADSSVYPNSGLFVLRHSSVPAALVEVAYMNHRADRALLAKPSFREKAAESIYNGLKSYVEGDEFFAVYRPDRRGAREAEASGSGSSKPAADPAHDH